MVPLEAEPPDIPQTEQGGVTAPISVLSKLAMKDAIRELEATVRKTRDISSTAAKHFWLSAEKRLGLEVDISDPALRELFGLHVLAVEDLCGRVRIQAEAALAAAEEFAQVDLGATASLLGPLARADSSSKALGSELLDAGRASLEVRGRLERRIQEEVFSVLDQRTRVHAEIREDLRERQHWNTIVERLRRDVAYSKKGSSGSGIRLLSGRTSASEDEEASARLLEAMQKVGDFDGKVLASLLNLSSQSVDAVRMPWASLLQIQSEYFTAQQAMWAPLGVAFEEAAADSPVCD